MKISYNLAASIDGYIADDKGGVSWLDKLKIDPADTGHEAFFETVDALVMGRDTYAFVQDYGEWPYGDIPVWVCTGRPLETMQGCNLQNGTDPETVHKCALQSQVEHLWLVGGGKLASSFLQGGLLTHVGISLMPIVLGSGIKLFDEMPRWKFLQQKSSAQMPGFTHIEYEVKN